MTAREYLLMLQSRRPEFDVGGWSEIREPPLGRLLRRLAESGMTGLLTPHILKPLARCCDRIHLLSGGADAGSDGPTDFDWLDALTLSGGTGERLECAHRLLGHPGARGSGVARFAHG